MLITIGQLLERGIGKFELLLNYVAVLMLSVMVLLGTADVIARYFFNSPIKGALEINGLLLAGSIFMIMGYVQAKRTNIRLELFIDKYPKRPRLIVDLIVDFLTLALFVLIAWQSFALAWKDIDYGRLIENIYLPIYPFEFLLTFGAVMVSLETLMQLVRTIIKYKQQTGTS